MYNEYVEDMNQTAISPNISTPEVQKTAATIQGGGFAQLLSSKLGSLKLDMNTLIAFAVIWFLLSDRRYRGYRFAHYYWRITAAWCLVRLDADIHRLHQSALHSRKASTALPVFSRPIRSP